MQCKQLVGPYAGQIIDLPYAVYQACKDAGTVVDVDAEHTVKGLKRGAASAPKPAVDTQVTKDPEVKVGVEARRGVVVPMLQNPFAHLPQVQRPEDVDHIVVQTFKGEESVPDGDYCVHGWPRKVGVSLDLLDQVPDVISIADGKVHFKMMNGHAVYKPFGVNVVDPGTIYSELVDGEFTPIPGPETAEKEPEAPQDQEPAAAESEASSAPAEETEGAAEDAKEAVVIPDDWESQHHNWKIARAEEIAGRDVKSKAEAEEIIKAYLAK